MRPLEHGGEDMVTQGPRDGLTALLRGGDEPAVLTEIERLERSGLSGEAAAAVGYARGALAMRTGHWKMALGHFEEAARLFCDSEAVGLCRCEAWLARMRLGPRPILEEAQAGLSQLAEDGSQLVKLVATHYRGTALRMTGQAEEALPVLLDALQLSEGFLGERAQVLNSLGTLYVVLGAHAAAIAVLEHAADLNHQLGDSVSEAISYGQLGSAALAQGERTRARRYLQQQFDCAGRVGDTFGQARALVFLADLAIDLERPDDALELAQKAVAIAQSGEVSMDIWVAYGRRNIGRALAALGAPGAEEELETAAHLFKKLGNVLGASLVAWDRTRRSGLADDEKKRHELLQSARVMADLSLTGRLADVLADVALTVGEQQRHQVDAAIAACAQPYPLLDRAYSGDWAYEKSDVLGLIARRRLAGQRNAGRLAVLVGSSPGLYLAALVADDVRGVTSLPPQRSAGALVARMPGCLLWAWSAETELPIVARDLSSLAKRFDAEASLALGLEPTATVENVPMMGEVGADVRPAAVADAIVSRARACPRGFLFVEPAMAWSGECEALVRMAGIEVRR